MIDDIKVINNGMTIEAQRAMYEVTVRETASLINILIREASRRIDNYHKLQILHAIRKSPDSEVIVKLICATEPHIIFSNKDILLTAVKEMREKKELGSSALHIANMDEVVQAIEERAATVVRFIGSGQAHEPAKV